MFMDYQKAYYNNDCGIYGALNGICNLYGETLQIKNMHDVENILQREGRTGKLKW